ncbi:MULTISPECIES: serine hydrolase domain-containing protein [Rhodonellum]|uniref:serine hydrolase domain-containing protein n=1 Tax=Rhodonellum TaxID=336827 RepID=UPI001F3BD49E|nr:MULTISPECIES: serine hydrolase domain-containing protein [Rhodonellum]MDO9553515.1 serine hydrolase domain-containing protein [Rhodonellum sp.]
MSRFLLISVCLLSFYACQTNPSDSQNDASIAYQDSLLQVLAAEEADRQKISIPASFTPESAQALGNQLDSIFNFLHQKKGFNGTVLFTKYDEVIFKGAFGYKDLARKQPLKMETAFQLASVSKQFTAMAIMMLKERGKLEYDDDIQQFIPNFPYPGITIRQLLTHRSGLSNYTYFSDKFWPDRTIPITNEDVINLFAQHQPAAYFQPNLKYEYSNTGYLLLASIVERASGRPFATFLEENIFGPLEMTNTFTFREDLPSENVAIGHTRNKRKRSPDYLDFVLGDKGMYSTVEDLYKWDQALYSNKLVKWNILEEALTGFDQSEKKGKEDYGFGWRIKTLKNGDPVWYHGGLWHGYNTYLLRNPKDHSTIIILSNVANGSLKFLSDLQDFLYPILPPTDTAENKNGKEGEIDVLNKS